MKTSKEEIQLIFRLRNRVTDLKINYKGIYDHYECDACGVEDESQKHILECPTLLSMNKEAKEIPKYENLFEGTICDQIKIARLFKQNMTIKENLLKK